jgi:hypothetical protein
MIDQKTRDRFMEKAFPDPNSGCWIWGAASGQNGIAVMCVKGRTIAAARISYMIHKGDIPEGHVVHHLCNNPACVSPYHLEPVTRQQNAVDGHYRKGKPDQVVSLDTTLAAWRAKAADKIRSDNPDWRKKLIVEITRYAGETGTSYRQLSAKVGAGPNLINQFMADDWKEPRFGVVVDLCRIMGVSLAIFDELLDTSVAA